MLSFDANITPNASTGILQAASTSVVYDSALYGCDAITAFGWSSSTITKAIFTF